MRKLIGISVFIAAIFLFQQNTLAEEPYKIGIISIQQCIQESNEGKRLSQELSKKYSEIQKRVQEKQEELAAMEKDLEKQSMMLSLEAQEDKQDEYEKEKRDLEYFVEDSNEAMTKAQNKAQQQILEDLEGIIKEIAEENGFDLILERVSGGVLYTSEPLDITDQVVDAYNKEKP